MRAKEEVLTEYKQVKSDLGKRHSKYVKSQLKERLDDLQSELIRIELKGRKIMNQVVLTGRLTKDIELRYNQNQTAVAKFSLALNSGYGDNERTDYPSCVAFGKTAELLADYSGKGLRVTVQGRIQTGSYTNKDGATVYTTDVVAERVEFIDWKDKQESTQEQGTIADNFSQLDEDLPF